MIVLLLLACGKPPADTAPGAAGVGDSGALDSASTDGTTDGGATGGGTTDGGDTDGGTTDGGTTDGGTTGGGTTDTEDTADTGAPLPATILVTGVGLAGPESMAHDPERDLYLVANINGSPGAPDDNGFISRLRPDGGVESLAWIDGADEAVTLHAPKGMALLGDELLVADLDTVRRFDLETGAPAGGWTVPGAPDLNGLDVGADGAVYVSNYAADDTAAIWRVDPATGAATALARGESLRGVNGVAAEPDGVVAVASTGVLRLGLDGARTDLPSAPGSALDGVLSIDGVVWISSWGAEAVYRLDGEAWIAAVEGVPSPADLGWDGARGRLLIPMLGEDAVLIQAAE